MIEFWLDNILFLINTQNFNFSNASPSQKNIQMLNIVAMISLIVGLLLVFIKICNCKRLYSKCRGWICF